MKLFRRKKKKTKSLVIEELITGYKLRASTDGFLLSLELSNGEYKTYQISYDMFERIVETADIFR